MTKKDILQLARNIRDGKSAEADKLSFLRAINVLLKESREILRKAKTAKK